MKTVPGPMSNAAWREKTELLRVLGHPTRLALLTALADGPKCVGDVQELVAVRQANVSQHLAVLRREKIVDWHESGKLRCYYIARPALVKALMAFIAGDYAVVQRSAEWVRASARTHAAGAKSSRDRTCACQPRTKSAGPDRVAHWNRVYRAKPDADLSWYQDRTPLSAKILDRLALPLTAPVIDVGGGGPAAFAGELLDRGFTDVSVLDVSAAGLQRCRERLGDRARQVHWLRADITQFTPRRQYDFWHDRAVFHFLTTAADRAAYVAALRRALRPGGYAMIAAFAPSGPEQCSDLNVRRWTPAGLLAELGAGFVLHAQHRETHRTPWGTPQAFVYAVFQRVAETEAGG